MKVILVFVVQVSVLTPCFPRYKGDFHGSFVKSFCDKIVKYIELEVIAPRTRTLKPMALDYPIIRFPYMPYQRMEYIAEATMKNASLKILSALPMYLTSAYIHLVSSRSDLVHTNLAIPLGFMAAYNPKRIPQIITCHGSDITYPIEKPIYRPVLKQVLKKANRIVTVSDYIRKYAIQLGAAPRKTSTIYLGVDVDRFHPNKRKKEIPTIGTLGRIIPEKSVDDLLYAAKCISNQIDFKLKIGGDGSDLLRLKNLAKKMNLNVEFTGRVTDPVSFHQSLDIFVLASTREGLSISLQEAMSCGVIPVTVNDCGCTEIICDGFNGFLFNSRDRRNLADKLLEAINSQRISHSSRETIVKRFNIDDATKKYLELYRELGILF